LKRNLKEHIRGFQEL